MYATELQNQNLDALFTIARNVQAARAVSASTARPDVLAAAGSPVIAAELKRIVIRTVFALAIVFAA